MGRIILALILLILPTLVQAGAEYSRPTATVTADGQMYTGAGVVTQIKCTTDGSNNLTINLYDNTAASGTKLLPTDYLIVADVSNREHSITFEPFPALFVNGLYLDVTTSGTFGCMAYYNSY